MIDLEPVNPRYIGNNNESILYFSFYLPLGLLLNYILNQISSYIIEPDGRMLCFSAKVQHPTICPK